jgi:hypothetical protein
VSLSNGLKKSAFGCWSAAALLLMMPLAASGGTIYQVSFTGGTQGTPAPSTFTYDPQTGFSTDLVVVYADTRFIFLQANLNAFTVGSCTGGPGAGAFSLLTLAPCSNTTREWAAQISGPNVNSADNVFQFLRGLIVIGAVSGPSARPELARRQGFFSTAAVTTAVPEPSSSLLVVGALVTFSVLRRRRAELGLLKKRLLSRKS